MEATQQSQIPLLGIEEMDNDHKELAFLSDRLAQVCSAGMDADAFSQALNRLYSSATLHFCREEALMVRTSYCDLVAHRAEHDALLSDLHKLRYRLASQSSRELNAEALPFVRSWLFDHIAGFDKMFAGWVQLQGMSNQICRALVDQAFREQQSAVAARGTAA